MTSKQEAIISGEQIKNMLLGAYRSFEKNYQYINDLNVFPVPDGDTGTNMMHTMAAVAREISQLQNGYGFRSRDGGGPQRDHGRPW